MTKCLIPITLSLQNKHEEGNNSKAKVTTLLSTRLVSMERQWWLNANIPDENV